MKILILFLSICAGLFVFIDLFFRSQIKGWYESHRQEYISVENHVYEDQDDVCVYEWVEREKRWVWNKETDPPDPIVRKWRVVGGWIEDEWLPISHPRGLKLITENEAN